MRSWLVVIGLASLLACGDSSGVEVGGSESSGTTSGSSTSTSSTGASASATGASASSTSVGSTTLDPTTGSPSTDPGSSGSSSTGSTSTDATGSDSSGGMLACPYRPVEGRPGFSLQLVSEGFVDPVLVVGDPLETDVLYVLQKTGQIKRVEPGEDAAEAEEWLDVGVVSSGEAGLLGLAFHPDYDTDPRVYVSHQPDSASNAVIVMEYTVIDGAIDEDSARPVIGMGKPLTNHNGGMIQFGLDGLLYFAVGDGGHQNDQCGHAQDTETFLGKVLRIDPNADGDPDTSPPCTGCFCVVPDLPFDYTIVANPAGPQLPEIYAVGFRNPWRFSIDPIDGRLWVADVGQDQWEEVAVVEAGSNHGWGGMEGFHCFNDGGCDIAGPAEVNADGYTMPVTEFEQTGGHCAIIGLGNYRSCEVPAWDGLYFYGDYCTGDVLAVRWDGTEVEELGEIMNAPGQLILGGGYNAYGDVFVTTEPFPGSGGSVYRIAPQ